MIAIRERGIWVVGGQTTTFNLGYPTHANVLSQIDLYDPQTDTWYPEVTHLPLPVTFAGVGAAYGKIYVSGGWDRRGVCRNELQIYDVATGTWSFGAPMPEPRAMHELIFLDDYLYATVGVNANHDAVFNPRTQWFRYHPTTNIWNPRFSMGFANVQTTVAGGIIRVIGGRSNSTTIASYHEGYFAQPLSANDTNTSSTTEQPLSRFFGGVVTYLARNQISYIVVLGGINTSVSGTWRNFFFHDLTSGVGVLTNNITYLNAPYEAPATWTNLSISLPQASALHRAIVVGQGVYIMGGTTTLPNPTPNTANWYLNFQTFPTSVPTPSPKSPMPVGRYGHALVRLTP